MMETGPVKLRGWRTMSEYREWGWGSSLEHGRDFFGIGVVQVGFYLGLGWGLTME
jgi:hypothetical protein